MEPNSPTDMGAMEPNSPTDMGAKEPQGFADICIVDSTNIQFGTQVEYSGPVNIQQYVTGLPAHLASRPEVGKGLAKAGLIAAASPDEMATVPPSLTLLLPGNKQPQEQFPLSWWVITSAILLGVLILSATLSLFVVSVQPEENPMTPILSEETYNPFLSTLGTNVTLSGKLRILERDEWFAWPVQSVPDLSHPAQFVVITETGGDSCTTEALCKLQVSQSQQRDMQQKLKDIVPNFLLAGDGYAYEGRGWDTANQCTTQESYDKNSICLSFVGTFSVLKPRNSQILATKQTIEIGLSLGKIVDNYTLIAANQVKNNIYPGAKLFEIIKTWPNWQEIHD